MARAFKALNENTALYFAIERTVKEGIRIGQLFSMIEFMENGEVAFRFSEFSAPYVFAFLRSQFYSFKLAELAQIKSKYAIILMKLWEANRFKNQRVTTIQGNLDDWQDWFLGNWKEIDTSRFCKGLSKK